MPKGQFRPSAVLRPAGIAAAGAVAALVRPPRLCDTRGRRRRPGRSDVVMPPPDPPGRRPRSNRCEPTRPSGRPPMPRICKVLIVEDHDEVRALLAEALAIEGFRFTAVETGEQMRAALDEDDHDVAILDVLLPGGEDGFALAETARALGCGVILITGDHRHAERLEQSGHPHLLKPFGVRDLLALVERVLAETTKLCVRRRRS